MTTPIRYYTATDRRAKQSALELAIIGQIQAAGVPLVPQVKLGNNWIWDGAVDGTKLLIEINGTYWHELPESVERDARKQAWAARNGYRIVTIWEHDYEADQARELKKVTDAYELLRPRGAAARAESDPKAAPPAIADRTWGSWRDPFLAQLAEGGIVREACIAAGVSRNTAYQARKDDPAFAEAWKHALQDAADKALAIYRQRATEQSDRAMEFFIKSRDPETYGAPAGSPIELLLKYIDLTRLSNEQIDRLAAGEDPIAVILGAG